MKRLGCLIQPWNIFSLITVADMEYIHAKETVLILVMKTNGKQSSFFFFWNGVPEREGSVSIAINLIYDWLRK